MADHIRFERRGRLFHVDIDMPMHSSKSAAISSAVEDDAGEASVDIVSEKRTHRLVAYGLIQPMTMRRIINELAR